MKRYEMVGVYSETEGEKISAIERADGEWVRYEDANAEIEQNKAIVEAAKDVVNQPYGAEHGYALTRLDAALSPAWEKANTDDDYICAQAARISALEKALREITHCHNGTLECARIAREALESK